MMRDTQGLDRGDMVTEGNTHDAQQRHGRRVEGGTLPRPVVRVDRDCRGQEMVSGEEAFPYSLLFVDQTTGKSTENQRNHFATTRMISEKRSQRNKQHKIVIR